MKKLIITLFVLGMLTVTTQTVRHAYVRCFYDRASVLDKYDDKIDLEIKGTVSLDSLLVNFDKVYNEVIDFEKDKSKKEINKINKYKDEPYLSKSKYKKAIIDWESKEEKIHEVIVFWIIGLLLILVGAFLYFKRLKWIGTSLIIPGIIQMLWWSSPSISAAGAHIEFLKFLNIKLIFSIITLLILIGMWLIYKKDESVKE
jgi:uncharacterized membrane protein YhaH (DUF805 family)